MSAARSYLKEWVKEPYVLAHHRLLLVHLDRQRSQAEASLKEAKEDVAGAKKKVRGDCAAWQSSRRRVEAVALDAMEEKQGGLRRRRLCLVDCLSVCQGARERAKREVKALKAELAELGQRRDALAQQLQALTEDRAARVAPNRLGEKVEHFRRFGRALPVVLLAKQVRRGRVRPPYELQGR